MKLRRAFTLVELLVCLAIVLVLAAILFPVFNRTHCSERRPACQSNLKQLGLGFLQYTQDWDEKHPPAAMGAQTGWATGVQPYVKSWQIYVCPSENSPAPAFGQPIDYWFNRRLSAFSVGKIKVPNRTVLLGEGNQTTDPRVAHSQIPPQWLNGQESPLYRHLETSNWLFADGHVKQAKPEKFQQFDAANGIYSLAP